MFDLYLHHGRHDPAQDMPDWGFDGPRISGVTGTHWTYGTWQIVFASAADATAAQEKTGWNIGNDDNMLEMPVHEDLAVATGKDGVRCYYGDWGLMLSHPSRWRMADAPAVEKARPSIVQYDGYQAHIAALKDAEAFVAGFEGDDAQEGIDGPNGLLARLRNALDGSAAQSLTDDARSIVSNLIEEATNTSAWLDALAGQDERMMEAVAAACALIGETVPGEG